ncbi:hypothetical protein DIPPA_19967 [Diplonema papillatum]|nr:hypothetical protein DIPPA_19967 [Diplonema papillatum]
MDRKGDRKRGGAPRGGGGYRDRDRRRDARDSRGPRDDRDRRPGGSRDRFSDRRDPLPPRRDRDGRDRAPAQQQSANRFAEYELPFNVKDRTLAEHFSRHLHRISAVPSDLLTVTCAWVDQPMGKLPDVLENVVEIDVAETENIAYTGGENDPDFEPEADRHSGKVELRALIACRTTKPTTRNALTGFDVFCARNQKEKAFLHAYGGYVDVGASPAAREAALTGFVRDQSSLAIDEWTPLVTFGYADGRSVAFYVPTRLSAGAVQLAKQQVTEKAKPAPPTPSKPEAKPDDAAADADNKDESPTAAAAAAAATASTAEEEKKEPEVEYETQVCASKVPLLNLLDRPLEGVPLPTAELALASDVLFEYLRREAVVKMKKLLDVYIEKKKISDAEAAKKAEIVEGIRQRRRDSHAEKKQARLDEDKERRAEWKKEVWGLTDDEKRQATREKEHALADERRAEDIAAEAAFNEELRKVDNPLGLKLRDVVERDDEALAVYQMLDKPSPKQSQGSGLLTKHKLCGLLLSLPNAGTAKAAMDYLSEVFPAGGVAGVNYRTLCETRSKVVIEEKKEEPKEEKKSEDAEMADESKDTAKESDAAANNESKMETD